MCVSSILIHPEIPRGLFPFLHPPHGAWQHKQGLHPTKGPYKSPLQVDLDQLKELKSKNMQSAQILQPAVLPRSWNPPHTQSFPCNHLHVQVTQKFINFFWIFFAQIVSNMFRHQKFGHHSQSEFSQRRHKSRPSENQRVSLFQVLMWEEGHFEGILHWRVSGLCQKECSAVERNHWRLGLDNTRSQLDVVICTRCF